MDGMAGTASGFDFDAPRAMRGSGSSKWDLAHLMLGRDDPDALPMWIAQMDFAPAPCLVRAAEAEVARGQWGYFTGIEAMFDRVAWWCDTRWGWRPDPAAMRATHGLGNAIGLCIQTYSDPGDRVIIFTPVYHEFTQKVRRNGREVLESPLRVGPDGRFELDLDGLEPKLNGRERIMLISQPHNPAGRIWTEAEMTAMGDFCARHGLILVSDEIHADLVHPGFAHVPAGTAVPQHLDRTVILTAASKTFDTAGLRVGTTILPDAGLRARFDVLHRGLDIQPNRMGVALTAAAYSPEGGAWVDDLRVYIAGNAAVLAEAVAAIPGAAMMPMEGTYLAWVEFAGTGMTTAEIARRVQDGARIVASPGPAFGTGGETGLRFNIGTRRANVAEAGARLRAAFADLQ